MDSLVSRAVSFHLNNAEEIVDGKHLS
jgi:hydroxylamine reductase (hybrid-cluster protein)